VELYETEEQQIDALKKWWQKNANSVISGLVGGLIIIAGWNFWQGYQQDTRLKASALYEELLSAAKKNQYESVNKIAQRLDEQYASTPYALYGKLFQAKAQVATDDLESAKQVLQSLTAKADSALKNVASIRLLRLLLATGEYEQGLQKIAEIDPQSSQAFNGQYEELKGDFYVALQRPGQARTAYQNALRAGQTSPLLQYKIDDLTAPKLLENPS